LDTLESLKAKAEEQLAALRKAESNTKQNYAMLKQSLSDQIAYDTKEMKEEQAFKSETEQQKAADTGELGSTSKLLANTQSALSDAQTMCMQTASDHDTSVAGRTAELKALADAKKIIQETTGGAVEQSYSFLQAARSRMQTRADLKRAEVVDFVKRQGEGSREIGSVPILQHSLLFKHVNGQIHHICNGHMGDRFGRIGGNVAHGDTSGLTRWYGNVVVSRPRLAQELDRVRKLCHTFGGDFHFLGNDNFGVNFRHQLHQLLRIRDIVGIVSMKIDEFGQFVKIELSIVVEARTV